MSKITNQEVKDRIILYMTYPDLIFTKRIIYMLSSITFCIENVQKVNLSKIWLIV